MQGKVTPTLPRSAASTVLRTRLTLPPVLTSLDPSRSCSHSKGHLKPLLQLLAVLAPLD